MSRKNQKGQRPQRSKRQFHLPTEGALAAPSAKVVKCVSGKMGFPLSVAEAKLSRYQDGNRPDRPIRVYPCTMCDAYHLTSQELKT